MPPRFLDLAHILQIHHSMIDHYGGSPGLRDAGLLQSALAMPATTYGGEYLHSNLFEQAAAYLYHLVLNHPFVDGNKRTGAAAALIFLAINDVNIQADEDGLVEITLSTIAGESNKQQIAEFFRSRATRNPIR